MINNLRTKANALANFQITHHIHLHQAINGFSKFKSVVRFSTDKFSKASEKLGNSREFSIHVIFIKNP